MPLFPTVTVLKKWRAFLYSTIELFRVITDYKNLVGFLITKELNYNIYNKELLGIVTALKEWRAFLQETIELFIVKTDYKNLTRFLTTKELNRR